METYDGKNVFTEEELKEIELLNDGKAYVEIIHYNTPGFPREYMLQYKKVWHIISDSRFDDLNIDRKKFYRKILEGRIIEHDFEEYIDHIKGENILDIEDNGFVYKDKQGLYYEIFNGHKIKWSFPRLVLFFIQTDRDDWSLDTMTKGQYLSTL